MAGNICILLRHIQQELWMLKRSNSLLLLGIMNSENQWDCTKVIKLPMGFGTSHGFSLPIV